MNKNYTSISKIEGILVKRISTGQEELDWLYGLSDFPDGGVWGMPVGAISVWVGEGGVGKSRLAIDVAKAKVINGSTVLYFQNEVSLSTLASWVNNDTLKNFYCSDATSLSEQIEIIKHLKPELVFIDSINLVEEFGSGTAKSIKTIIDGYREAIAETGSHVVVLCQLNKQNSATGSTALTHLPDVTLMLTNTDQDGIFRISIGKKNRYGRTGSAYTGLWRHIETGVKCISFNRNSDERWSLIDETGFPPIPKSALVDSEFPPIPTDGINLDNCSPAVRDAYYSLYPEQRPSFLRKLLRIKK